MVDEEEPGKPERTLAERLTIWSPEYFVVRAGSDWIVSKETAQSLQRQLGRPWLKPRWIRFVDITGAVVSLQRRDIYWMKQSTPESRDLWRRFKQERRNESIAEVPDYDVDF